MLALNLFVLILTGCMTYRNQELSVLMMCPYFLVMKLMSFFQYYDVLSPAVIIILLQHLQTFIRFKIFFSYSVSFSF
uniref:Putative secreted protein n=1 Tax=Anopheles darlingi TaxID=43151 RepID=A0A2M4D8R5_ANODA